MSSARGAFAPALRLLLLLSWLCVRPLMAAPVNSPPPNTRSLIEIAVVADWVCSLQYTDAMLGSYGAVKTHHTPGFAAPDGTSYFRVVPYQSNLALLGLMRATLPAEKAAATVAFAKRRQVVERWIQWYFNHLKPDGTPPGIVLDHWYQADGTGETTCPPGIAPALCHFDDASDSAAATFLGLVWAYQQSLRHDPAARSVVDTPDNKKKLETIAGVMLALQQADGLAWAKDSYRVKYLMDNSEVFWGLQSMARLESEVFHDRPAAQKYQAAAEKVRSAIMKLLYNEQTRRFRVALFEDGVLHEANLATWYPDAAAQVWPHLFGVIESDSKMAREALTALNEQWDGMPLGDWTRSLVDGAGFPWTSIGYAALLAGDKERARRHARLVCDLKLPKAPGEQGFATPFTVIDAGWLLMTLSELSR